MGRSEILLTQNVDRLHQAAGSARVIDLHGRIDLVRCMGCERRTSRDELQDELGRLNPAGSISTPRMRRTATPTSKAPTFRPSSCRPAGAAAACSSPTSCFSARTCPATGSMRRSDISMQADAMLIVGSSLMVYSGFRFVERAASAGKPVAAVNLGRTRADGLSR